MPLLCMSDASFAILEGSVSSKPCTGVKASVEVSPETVPPRPPCCLAIFLAERQGRHIRCQLWKGCSSRDVLSRITSPLCMYVYTYTHAYPPPHTPTSYLQLPLKCRPSPVIRSQLYLPFIPTSSKSAFPATHLWPYPPTVLPHPPFLSSPVFADLFIFCSLATMRSRPEPCPLPSTPSPMTSSPSIYSSSGWLKLMRLAA